MVTLEYAGRRVSSFVPFRGCGRIHSCLGVWKSIRTRHSRILRAAHAAISTNLTSDTRLQRDDQSDVLPSRLPRYTGVFSLGGTIVGTAAFGLYQGQLGVRFHSDELAQTGDIDFARKRRTIPGKSQSHHGLTC